MASDPFGRSSLSNLATLGHGIRSRRKSSYDPTGGNADAIQIPAGETLVLADLQGAGIIRHIWMTTGEANNALRGLVLRAYWDGESTPSVQVPLGDFFGLGHAKGHYFDSMPIQTNFLGMNCFFPLPFATGAKITVTNELGAQQGLYFYVDYHELDAAPDNTARFHACWRRQLVRKVDAPRGPNRNGRDDALNPTGENNYLILDVKGKGHYVGCVLSVDTDEPGWWGEGDDLFVIDGEPQLLGTGTEDYFCGAWNYHALERTCCTAYHGYSFKGNADYTGKHTQYRFHIEDPVYFEKSLRFSIEHGHANDKQGDWTSVAYWYQIGRTDPLPDLGKFDDRIPYAFGGLERWPGKDRSGLPR
jgi:hypothetical protein